MDMFTREMREQKIREDRFRKERLKNIKNFKKQNRVEKLDEHSEFVCSMLAKK